jgi:hypothetical protein
LLPSKRLTFEVKSFFMLLAPAGVSFPWKIIQKKKAPTRVAFFVWATQLYMKYTEKHQLGRGKGIHIEKLYKVSKAITIDSNHPPIVLNKKSFKAIIVISQSSKLRELRSLDATHYAMASSKLLSNDFNQTGHSN